MKKSMDNIQMMLSRKRPERKRAIRELVERILRVEVRKDLKVAS